MPPINTVAIIGRGIIGSSWALVFARAGLSVRIWDRSGNRADTISRIATMIASLHGTSLQGDAGTLERITVHSELAHALENAQYVQESIAENLETKRRLFSEIE